MRYATSFLLPRSSLIWLQRFPSSPILRPSWTWAKKFFKERWLGKYREKNLVEWRVRITMFDWYVAIRSLIYCYLVIWCLTILFAASYHSHLLHFPTFIFLRRIIFPCFHYSLRCVNYLDTTLFNNKVYWNNSSMMIS